MRNLLFVAVLGLAVGSTANGHAEEPSRSVELIKSPSCGCCAAYGDYLEASGFEVTTRPVEDIVGLSRLGAEVVVCGPPTMLPPGIEALGCRATPRRDEAVAALNLKLWDEDAGRLVPFPKPGPEPAGQGARGTGA